MKKKITAGEILLNEYLKPMAISQSEMAQSIHIKPHTLNEIILGKHPITPTMSIRFGAFFGQSDEFWYGIQSECDFRSLRCKKEKIT